MQCRYCHQCISDWLFLGVFLFSLIPSYFLDILVFFFVITWMFWRRPYIICFPLVLFFSGSLVIIAVAPSYFCNFRYSCQCYSHCHLLCNTNLFCLFRSDIIFCSPTFSVLLLLSLLFLMPLSTHASWSFLLNICFCSSVQRLIE